MTATPRIGIQLPEVERVVRWREVAAIARAAEEVGFDSIWVGDHLLYRDDGQPERGPWEAWTSLAALAAVTTRVRLGPLVACLAFHPPAVLAKLASTVADVSGGRLTLGVGAGWNEPDFRAFDLPFDRRVARFEESFGIIRRLLSGERVTAHGEFADVEDCVLLPPPLHRVPLMVGSNGPRMLAATLPHVDAWNTWYTDHGNDPAGFAALDVTITDAARAAGRDPSTLVRSACVLVAPDGPTGARPGDHPPVTGDEAAIARALRAFGEAGADEVIVVADPIDEATVRRIGGAVAALGRDRA